ncbi:MAG: S26 family signal peptidase [Thaumarchaeota archaeon]|nr:S26 family signal peptidase [Nitrososphaerota archaeon]
MSDDVIDIIQHLMDEGIGDFQRLDHILSSLKAGKKIYFSDQRYLEDLISKNIQTDVTRLKNEIKNSGRTSANIPNPPQIKTSPLWYYLPLFFSIIGGTISYAVLRKTDMKKAKKCFAFGLILFLIPIVTFAILNFVPGMQYSLYMVKTSANEQNLKIHDIVITDISTPFENIKVGDLIIFYNPNGHDRILLHRVVEILDKNPFTIKTKGDNNLDSVSGIDFPITKQEYIGRAVFTIPQEGYNTRIVIENIVLITITTIMGFGVVQHVRYRKKISIRSKNDSNL